jgi:hypothetical protein
MSDANESVARLAQGDARNGIRRSLRCLTDIGVFRPLILLWAIANETDRFRHPHVL